MERDEMIMRAGVYAGTASRLLKDDSYIRRWRGRTDEMTEEEFWEATHEIEGRLVAAGLIVADEDPYYGIFWTK